MLVCVLLNRGIFISCRILQVETEGFFKGMKGCVSNPSHPVLSNSAKNFSPIPLDGCNWISILHPFIRKKCTAYDVHFFLTNGGSI